MGRGYLGFLFCSAIVKPLRTPTGKHSKGKEQNGDSPARSLFKLTSAGFDHFDGIMCPFCVLPVPGASPLLFSNSTAEPFAAESLLVN